MGMHLYVNVVYGYEIESYPEDVDLFDLAEESKDVTVLFEHEECETVPQKVLGVLLASAGHNDPVSIEPILASNEFIKHTSSIINFAREYNIKLKPNQRGRVWLQKTWW
jgi:hypothetical protein